MSQNDMILNYIIDNGSITPEQAVMELGCLRLSARVSDLKKSGIPVRTEIVKSKNRFGKDVRFAKYFIDKGATVSGVD